MNANSRPTVAATFALTADGKVTTRNNTPSLFTSPRDKARLLEKRALADAVMVGRGTVEADTMEMGLPDARLRAARSARGQSEYPLRVIVSPSGKVRADLRVFENNFSPVVVATSLAGGKVAGSMLGGRAEILVAQAPDEKNPSAFDLSSLLELLKECYGVGSVACEGGPTLLRGLLEANLVDTLHLTVAPVLFGGSGAATITGTAGDFFLPPKPFKIVSGHRVGDEYFVEYEQELGAPKG